MANSVYRINKGINKSVEFKGLRAQYIWYLGVGILLLMIIYGTMYFLGIPTLVCIVIIAIGGTATVSKVYSMNAKYGEHGMMKEMARRRIPKAVRCNSRSIFIKSGYPGNSDLMQANK